MFPSLVNFWSPYRFKVTSNTICFIITLLCKDELLRCGLKVKRDKLMGDCDEYPMEPENRKQLWNLLPEHVRNYCNTIVEVTEIFDIEEVK